ncbi:unnamed protein product [Symbiodinium sp. CCMP2456]|nr:unnamed protein product [Symbiodinium sp. CCMP2456]
MPPLLLAHKKKAGQGLHTPCVARIGIVNGTIADPGASHVLGRRIVILAQVRGGAFKPCSCTVHFSSSAAYAATRLCIAFCPVRVLPEALVAHTPPGRDRHRLIHFAPLRLFWYRAGYLPRLRALLAT